MKQNTKIKLIIVEGRNDLLFLNFLFKNFLLISLKKEPPENNQKFYLYCENREIFIMESGGFQKEETLVQNIELNIQTIKTILKKENIILKNENPTFDLNLIIDADDNLSERNKQVYNVFTELRKLQDIKIDKTEYFLLPGAKKTGQLEDLIYESLSTLKTPNFECFDAFKECMNKPSLKSLHNKNDNFFSKLRLEYYFAFFANKDNDTSCDMAKKLKFIEEKIILTEEDKKKIALKEQNKIILTEEDKNKIILKKQNNNKVYKICSELIKQLSTFMGKTLDVNHPPLEGG